ncbi:hypothetical protein BH10BDE1_BH10BDE1_16690 [soil metagenome]
MVSNIRDLGVIQTELEELIREFKSDIDFARPLRGQLDSYAIVELVERIEIEFAVKIVYSDFTAGFLSSLEQSVTILQQAQGKK